MSLLSNIFFINLESRKDRLQHVTNELSKLKCNTERINAVKLADGALGCTMSHIKALELAKSRDLPYVFICEDDITFLNPTLLLENVEKFEKNIENWDVLIIGGNNCPPYTKISDYCIRIYNNQTTPGYVVKSHYYDVLIKNFKESAVKLMKEPKQRRLYALDMYWKSLQSMGQWYMIIPPTVIQYEDYSDIEKRNVNYQGLMLDLNKEWLFNRSSFSIP